MRIGAELAERLVRFAVAVLRLVKALPKDIAGRRVGSQLARSATSSGANYEEARAAESRADFVHKLGVAAKEMRETIFWLEVVHRTGWTTADLLAAIREANELAAILAASKRTAKMRV